MKDQTVIVSFGVSVGVLALAGLGVGAYFLLHREKGGPVASGTGTQGQGGLLLGNGVVAAVGPQNGWDVVAKMEQAQAAREAEWRKADKINGLQRDLANAQNEIKRLTDQLNNIDASPVSEDIVAAIARQRVNECE